MVEKIIEGKAASTAVFEQVESLVRSQVQVWLQRLLEEEVTAFLGRTKSERRAAEEEAGYRNGYGKPRRLSMMGGTIAVRRPRVRGLAELFESRLLPLFQRRTKEVGEVLPQLYLHGLAQGDFELALRGLLGEGAPLSASSIERLRGQWVAEYQAWNERSLADIEPVYLWADGIYVKAGLEDSKACLLVIVAGLADGSKVVLAVDSGHRESKESWARVLRDLLKRGMAQPRLVVADGHLGIWAALAEVLPEVEEQRCWNHKLTNVLDHLPKKLQARAKADLRKIPTAPTEAEAIKRRDVFVRFWSKDHPKAVEALQRDWERMVTFYRFPQQHWKHLRTTNPVESPFAAVRLRTGAAKRYKKVANATALIWKVLLVAQSSFRKLNHPELLPQVAAGAEYRDGVKINKVDKRRVA